MLEFRPFHPDDTHRMILQPRQQAEAHGLDWREIAARAASLGPAWTAVAPDGTRIAVGGYAIMWPGRAQVWMWAHKSVRPAEWLALTRHARRTLPQLRELGIRRVEAETPIDFKQGNRWLWMLGFNLECRADNFGPTGETYGRFSRLLWPD